MWSRLPEEMLAGLDFADVLGKGSFGTVVLAEKKVGDDEVLWADNCDITGNTLRCGDGSALVAVKMIKPRKSEEALAMREGLVLATIASIKNSDLIPKCIDYGVSRGLVYIVLEYFDGVSLDRVLAEEGPLPAKEVARVGADIAEALSVVHRAGFVYRDVKPHNVLRCLGADGLARYRLVDFGSTAGIEGCLFGSEEISPPPHGLGWKAGTQELEEELQNLLLGGGGGETDGASSCRIVEDGQETADRLAQVFHNYDDEDRGYLPADEVSQCMAAVSLKPELAPAAINAMSRDEFVGLFAQLVRRQDEHIPVGTFS